MLIELALFATAAGGFDATEAELNVPGMVLVAPDAAWGIRSVANYIDDQLDGLDIQNHPGVSCEDFPEYRCITVETTTDKGGIGWYTRSENLIEFNGERWADVFRPRVKQAVAAHELMHALGMDHHEQVGVIGNDGTFQFKYTLPSRVEMRVLKEYYVPA